MAKKPAIGRCQHIKGNGTQCGSPALRGQELCYQHTQCPPERVKVKGADGETSEIVVPLFEDAASIQTMVRQVAVLLLRDRIDGEKAGRLLYALQIASANLKRLAEEKPRPVQVVVDTDKVAETPMGMTPWSPKKCGHEPEKVEDEKIARTKREILKEQEQQEINEQNEWRGRRIDEVARWMESNRNMVSTWMGESDNAENLKWRLGVMKDYLEESLKKLRKGEDLQEW